MRIPESDSRTAAPTHMGTADVGGTDLLPGRSEEATDLVPTRTEDGFATLGLSGEPSSNSGDGGRGNRGRGSDGGGSGDDESRGERSGAPDKSTVSERRRTLTTKRGWQDILFRATARTGGFTVMVIMLLVGVFLAIQGFQALQVAGPEFFTTQEWEPNDGNFGIAAVLFGTVTIALIAILIAIPLALGTALYISEYAPLQLKQTLISVVDLMAAVPSVVYGLWGMFLLEGAVLPFSQWLATYFGWIPFLAVTDFDPADPLASPTVFTASAFIAGIVVALMISPIASSIMREVFSQAPIGEREGALALGSTRWGMITSVVLPFGRGGIIGGTMLGLGRALGETIAVYLVISPVFVIQPHILQTGTNSISALIALRYSEANEFGLSALMAAGLSLFLITLVVNFGASIIISRSRSGASSEG